MEIGLMGVDENGVMFTPKGTKICKLPKWIAFRVQKIQHWFACIGMNKNKTKGLPRFKYKA